MKKEEEGNVNTQNVTIYDNVFKHVNEHRVNTMFQTHSM